MPDDETKINDPLLVVEVISPSSRARDVGAKLADYFRIPGLRHYLVVRTEDRTIIHHQREAMGAISNRISRGQDIVLQPPGLVLPADWGGVTTP